MKTYKMSYIYCIVILVIALLPTWWIISYTIRGDITETTDSAAQLSEITERMASYGFEEVDPIYLVCNNISIYFCRDNMLIYCAYIILAELIFCLIYESGKKKDFMQMLPFSRFQILITKYVYSMLMLAVIFSCFVIGSLISGNICLGICADAGCIGKEGVLPILTKVLLPEFLQLMIESAALLAIYYAVKELCNNLIAAVTLYLGVLLIPNALYLLFGTVFNISWLKTPLLYIAKFGEEAIIYHDVDKVVNWKYAVTMIILTILALLIAKIVSVSKKKREVGFFVFPSITIFYLCMVFIWIFVATISSRTILNFLCGLLIASVATLGIGFLSNPLRFIKKK